MTFRATNTKRSPKSWIGPSGSRRACAIRRDFQLLELLVNGFHCPLRVAKEFSSANAREDPPHTFEHCLPVHVLRKFFKRIVAIAIALDRQPPPVAFHDQVDSESADTPVRGDSISSRHEAFHDLPFERRLRALFFFLQCVH